MPSLFSRIIEHVDTFSSLWYLRSFNYRRYGKWFKSAIKTSCERFRLFLAVNPPPGSCLWGDGHTWYADWLSATMGDWPQRQRSLGNMVGHSESDKNGRQYKHLRTLRGVDLWSSLKSSQVRVILSQVGWTIYPPINQMLEKALPSLNSDYLANYWRCCGGFGPLVGDGFIDFCPGWLFA